MKIMTIYDVFADRTGRTIVGGINDDFDAMPPVLNLVEPESPTRAELVSILLNARPDLKAFRIPFIVLRTLSPFLKLLQRILRPKAKPIDIYAAFAPEKYDSRLAAKVIESADASFSEKHEA